MDTKIGPAKGGGKIARNQKPETQLAEQREQPSETEPQKARVIQIPRRKKSTRILAFFTIVVPTILGMIYYGLIATDVYVSQAQMTIRSMSGTAMPSGSILDVIGGVGGSTEATDSHVVASYIQSRDLLNKLQAQINLKSKYAIAEADYFSRLDADATAEEFLDYYRTNIVEVYFDEATQITTLTVRAFSPEDAKEIAGLVIKAAENVVNRLSDKARNDAVRFAQKEVRLAEDRLSDIRRQASMFREEKGMFRPEDIGGIVVAMETQIAEEKARLAAVESVKKAESSEVLTLKAKIKALEEQVVKERARLANPSDQATPDAISQYANLQLQEEFAQNAYAAAITSLEMARAEAQRKHRYLEAFDPPNLPDEAIEPEREMMILTVLLSSIVLFGIVALVTAAIREHSRI